jgi:hypothetical protein
MAANRTVMPRDAVIDRVQAVINGTSAPDQNRRGFMSRKRAKRTLDTFKVACSNPISADQLNSAELKKNVTIATGLHYFDLRAPALNLFPTVTPLRNALPRAQRQFPGDAAHWKSVLSTTGSGFPFMGWVPEGRRSASMSYDTQNNSLSYMTLGEEDSLTEEARFAAEGFEDEDALVQLRLLLRTFIKEEAGLLGGDNSLQLGTPTGLVVSQATTGGTVAAGSYFVKVVALTQEGFLNSSVTNGVATTLTITGNDGQSYVLNGGSSNASAEGTATTTTATSVLSASVTPVVGAVAYAWYVGSATGAETLQAITTINSFAMTAPPSTGNQPSSAVTSDHSTNPNFAFDGLLTTAFKPSSNAFVNVFPTGTPGQGTPLTSSGVGGVNEIDTMFQQMWNTNLLSPTVAYVNSQELRNITAKTLNGSSAPLLRYFSDTDAQGGAEYKLTAAGVVAFYFNPYTPDGGVKLPINIHPNLAPGTIFTWAEHLPPWYVSNAVPECAVVQTRQDYYAEVWPKTTRTQFYGVYSQEVLAVYVPFAMGVLTNIANG